MGALCRILKLLLFFSLHLSSTLKNIFILIISLYFDSILGGIVKTIRPLFEGKRQDMGLRCNLSSQLSGVTIVQRPYKNSFLGVSTVPPSSLTDWDTDSSGHLRIFHSLKSGGAPGTLALAAPHHCHQHPRPFSN